MSSEVIDIARISDGGSSQPQIQARVDLFKNWNIPIGSKIIEIGCGQGDCTLVMAYLVGEQGHVTGIDPAPLDYGAPTTLGQAQDKLKQSVVGNRITFHQSDLKSFLDSSASEPLYDYAVFARSTWYLSSAEELTPMLVALRGRTKHLCIAEYSTDIQGDIAALPHLLAAISQAEFNSRDNNLDRHDNIQSIIPPQKFRELALKAGWVLEKEDLIRSPEDQEDARWEVARVLSESYRIRSQSTSGASRQEYADALIGAVEESKRALGPNPKLRTLPTWLASWAIKWRYSGVPAFPRRGGTWQDQPNNPPSHLQGQRRGKAKWDLKSRLSVSTSLGSLKQPPLRPVAGAGPSGLVTAKTLLHNFPQGTFSPVIFDSRHEVGGLWSSSGTGTLNPSMRTNLSSFTVAFSDLAWESVMETSGVPMFPQARQVGRSDGNCSHEETESEEFDLLVVASGYFAQKHVPSIPGLKELTLAGRVVHSSELQTKERIQSDSNHLAHGNIAIIGGSMSGVEAASAVALHQSSDAHNKAQVDKHVVHHIHSRPFWTLPTHLPHETSEISETVSFLPLDLAMYDLGRRPPGPIEYALGVIPKDKIAKTNEYFSSLLGAEYKEFGHMQGNPSQNMNSQPPWVAIGNNYAEFVRSGAIQSTMGRAVSVKTNQETKLSTIEIASADGQTNTLDNIASIVLATGFTPFDSLSLLPADVLAALEYSKEDPFLPLVLDKGGTIRSEVPDLGFVGFYRGPYWGVMEMQARFLGAEWIKKSRQPLKTETQRQSLRILRGPDKSLQRGQFPMGDYVGLMESFSKDLGIDRTGLSENDSRSGPAIPARYTYKHPSITAHKDMCNEKERTLSALKALSDPSHQSLQDAAALAVFRALHGTWRFSREEVAGNKESGTATLSPRYPSSPAYDREYVCDEYLDSDLDETSFSCSKHRSIFRLSESGAQDGNTDIEIWGGDPVEAGENLQRLHLTPFYRKEVDGEYTPGEHVIYAKSSASSLRVESETTKVSPRGFEYVFHFKGVSIASWEKLEPDAAGAEGQALSRTRTIYTR
ncbi:FAD-dependent pyridine nucleotide-disulfide oxidoreductase [Penicillium longicatenatum]|uniref:FAD-dependent pyridine nucleotide-disulfide oxidoreductase n=1 Tax=Penicillium longicatenatum TaxID=1561947 RepID=UPI002548D170|nr:FAD-dependent pyridine nucleotide-disulfide oxidoreductase [Penicillium longicatenatum]KAJ5658463.1 FAD-dependent pyridine nucleotide-disulfide oxidoreductase [Penicillium longicatenatum]